MDSSPQKCGANKVCPSGPDSVQGQSLDQSVSVSPSTSPPSFRSSLVISPLSQFYAKYYHPPPPTDKQPQPLIPAHESSPSTAAVYEDCPPSSSSVTSWKNSPVAKNPLQHPSLANTLTSSAGPAQAVS